MLYDSMDRVAKFKGELDRISSLGDDILHQILLFLPIKDAVQTSVLSTRWRYLFTSISILDFSQPYCLSDVSVKNFQNFNNFVDKLLYTPNQASLEYFGVSEFEFPEEDDLSGLPGWIRAALGRGVKDIYIDSWNPMPADLLFASQSLVTMKLNFHSSELQVPSKISVPNLKTLHLHNVVVSDGSIFGLISSCLVLEELDVELEEMRGNISELSFCNPSLKRLLLVLPEATSKMKGHVIVINAPHLVCFKYSDVIADSYCLSSMNSVVEAEIRVYQCEVAKYDVYRESGVTNLLQTICNAKSLHLEMEQPETVMPMHGELLLLPFHKLVELEIHNQGDNLHRTWYIEFLHCLPNLKKLTMEMEYFAKAIQTEIQPFSPKEVPSCLLLHLKEIKITYDWGDEEQIFEMISYILHHAAYLEKFIIPIDIGMREELSITKRLSELTRISKKCRILVNLG